jgi:Phage P22-like portal protein
MPAIAEKDREFLKEARDRFRYVLERWQDTRDEHDTDIRFLAGDQWDEKEKQNRTDKHRPMVVLDELTQYINQLINDVRQNKREAKVNPEGYGADEKGAEILENWVRSIQYKSNAQSAYITGFEGAAGASYGFWKLETFYENDKDFNQSVRIVPIPNANTILYDPDCLQYDCSDAQDCFEINFIPFDKFKAQFPNASIREFTDEIRQEAPDWVKQKQVQVASWWKVETEEEKIHEVKLPGGETHVMKDSELPENVNPKDILQTRTIENRRVVQYVLNGVEILETNDPDKGKGWPGKWIPIIPCWGKELFLQESTGSKRILLSLIRIARDAQRLLNYYGSQEMEEAKMTPRTPYMVPKGMISDNLDQWASLNDEPRAAIEFDPTAGATIPPGAYKPDRIPFQPNFQAYEIVKEAAKRSIQAAMGISPLPSAALRRNEKSGVALERIEGERAQGTFHFLDNYSRSLEFTGRQLEDVYHVLHDTQREISVRDRTEKHKVITINDPAKPETTVKGQYSVTISTGPSYQSQREEAASFADTFVQHAPQLLPLIADLIVKMRELGPLGDEMAKRLTPPQFANDDGKPLDPNAVAQIHQAAQQIALLQAQVKALLQEKQAKTVETASRERIAAMQEQTKLIVAEATLKRENAQSMLESELQKIQMLLDEKADQLDKAHEVAMASHQAELDKDQATHEAGLQPAEDSGNNASDSGS